MSRRLAASFIAICVVFAAASVWWLNGLWAFVAGFVVASGLLVAGVGAAEQARGARPRAAVVAGTLSSIAVVASIVFYAWPLRAAYAVSRPAMERIADELRAGRHPDGPMWAGVFRIEQAEISYSGVPALWIDTNPAGRTGFALCEPARPPFNLQWHVALDEHWQFVVED